jgi:hypothetical protein
MQVTESGSHRQGSRNLNLAVLRGVALALLLALTTCGAEVTQGAINFIAPR